MKAHDLYDMALRDHDLRPVIAYGSAGTGKTYGAVKAAVEWLEKSKKSKFIGIRPNISFAEKNGFLPGNEKEKNEPWIRPIRYSFNELGLSYPQQETYEKYGKIQYYPLEHIQGLTFDNAFIVVDECQNMSFEQIKGLVTRIGKYSKLVMCGDIAQISPKFHQSGLAKFLKMLDKYDANVHQIEFTRDDILRSELCRDFIIMFEDYEADNGQ